MMMMMVDGSDSNPFHQGQCHPRPYCMLDCNGSGSSRNDEDDDEDPLVLFLLPVTNTTELQTMLV